MLASGTSPRTVMTTLGHSQIALTMNTYAHVLPEVERAAVNDARSGCSDDPLRRLAV
jgi:integrase